MKQKLLALIKDIETSGLIESLQKSSDSEELKNVWQEWKDENHALHDKIITWAAEFKYFDTKPIFEEGEEIENPLEIIVIIRIIKNDEISEFEIFEETADLIRALRNIGSDFADNVAIAVEECLICDIDIEDIFPEG